MKQSLCFILFCCFTVIGFGQTPSPGSIKEFVNIPYLEPSQMEVDSLQRLNLVIPEGTEGTPLLIWIGGGAWSYVDRHQEMDFARKLATEGIAVASIGHRQSTAIWRDSSLNSGIQHPKHIEDVAASVRWLYQNASKYGIDRDQFFIGGYSSGAHLAALLCLDSSYLLQENLPASLFQGVIPISGAYDITHYYEVMLNGGRPELAELHVKAVFGDQVDQFPLASPVHFLDRLSIPILLIADNNVYNYTRLLEDRIRATDFRQVQVMYAYHLSHAALWRNLSFDENSIYRTSILHFIRTTIEEG
jgi:acetyl esterase/lipase